MRKRQETAYIRSFFLFDCFHNFLSAKFGSQSARILSEQTAITYNFAGDQIVLKSIGLEKVQKIRSLQRFRCYEPAYANIQASI